MRILSLPPTSNCKPPAPNPVTLAVLEEPELNSSPELLLVDPDFILRKALPADASI